MFLFWKEDMAGSRICLIELNVWLENGQVFCSVISRYSVSNCRCCHIMSKIPTDNRVTSCGRIQLPEAVWSNMTKITIEVIYLSSSSLLK